MDWVHCEVMLFVGATSGAILLSGILCASPVADSLSNYWLMISFFDTSPCRIVQMSFAVKESGRDNSRDVTCRWGCAVRYGTVQTAVNHGHSTRFMSCALFKLQCKCC